MRWMSCGCSPIVGSSNTYVMSVSADPRWRIIFVRCASPPDSEPDGRFSDRYPSPMSTNESSVSRSARISGATDGSSKSFAQRASSRISIPDRSAMETPSILDARASALSRVPSHSGQVVKTTAFSTKARMWGCIASTSLESIDFWICGIRPM
jgi:hypothetical protein